MIGYLSGTIQHIGDKYLILDVNNVGYRVTMGEKMKYSLPDLGAKIKVYTHYLHNPRDGAVELFGFSTPEELNFFGILTTVSGIGAKSAQGIMAKSDLQNLQLAIINSDEKYLRVVGLGPKIAQRLIIELKEKLRSLPVSIEARGAYASGADAIEALCALGYSSQQAHDALKETGTGDASIEDRISAALKILAKK